MGTVALDAEAQGEFRPDLPAVKGERPGIENQDRVVAADLGIIDETSRYGDGPVAGQGDLAGGGKILFLLQKTEQDQEGNGKE